jgi:chromate transport protein ChrA
LSDRIVNAIEIGIKYLLGNIRFSAPFIIIIVFQSLISLIINAIAKQFDSQFVLYGSSIFLIFLSTFVSFWIFISAALVLKEKLLKI